MILNDHVMSVALFNIFLHRKFTILSNENKQSIKYVVYTFSFTFLATRFLRN